MIEYYCNVNEQPFEIEIDTMLQDFITCPYCGYKNHDSWEWADMKGSYDYECPNCEKVCILEEPVMTIQYTTTKKAQ